MMYSKMFGFFSCILSFPTNRGKLYLEKVQCGMKLSGPFVIGDERSSQESDDYKTLFCLFPVFLNFSAKTKGGSQTKRERLDNQPE